MMTLILGGSGSGKSAYAEEYLCALAKGKRKYYLATMKGFDEETRAKISRHRKMRKGKDFSTIEQPVDILCALSHMEKGEKTALLECMSNLTANEMFAFPEGISAGELAEKLSRQIMELQEELSHLVVVSNNVFEDGIQYDTGTGEYLNALGRINERLAVLADEVIEVVVGIPVILKKGEDHGNP
ncbi:MAG: bifunctional adenosylcobinamide kinase/adenosylcobinamide-phosphate guanylyltransferase [Lachnospiraceae bacterium]|nr:bifunctional adenosylcobinamide kinase/adenosylcobinamide-phosphate guanylyltransferase [Lachnospiraceae bacterium]